MTPTATVRITAGLLVRGQVRREVRNAAEDAGLKCDVEQDGPDIRFHLSGDERKIRAFSEAVNEWVDSH
jgi:hypothetical protein